MSAFDKIIGYTSIKEELKQISDILKNREIYDKLGVSAPRGLLLYGEPGVGKSLMARAVIEDSGCKVFCCRKDSPNGDFVKKLRILLNKRRKMCQLLFILMIWISLQMEMNSIQMQKNMLPCNHVLTN